MQLGPFFYARKGRDPMPELSYDLEHSTACPGQVPTFHFGNFSGPVEL